MNNRRWENVEIIAPFQLTVMPNQVGYLICGSKVILWYGFLKLVALCGNPCSLFILYGSKNLYVMIK
jgi:hypothetical protein